MSTSTGRRFVELSAVTAGVKDVREVIERARDALGMQGQGTVLFVDEVHRFSKTQQDALLPAVENGWVTLVAATTENTPAMSKKTKKGRGITWTTSFPSFQPTGHPSNQQSTKQVDYV